MYTTYDIFEEVLDLRNIIDRFFNEVPYQRRRVDYPFVNLYERGDELEVRVMAPGVRPESLNLQLIDDSLIIEGEKKEDYADKPYIRRERAFGNFQKAVKLPFRVNPDSIKAIMRDGILTVKLARSEEAKPRKIEIK